MEPIDATPPQQQSTGRNCKADTLQTASALICIQTRMRLRHWWYLLPAYVYFRRLVRPSLPGLLRAVITIESPWAFHTVSIWKNKSAILNFERGNHPLVVRWAFRNTSEICSTEWHLSRISPRQQWGGQPLVPTELFEPSAQRLPQVKQAQDEES